MSLTYAAYTAQLAGLTVGGVVKRFAQAPAQLSTAQLPAMWPRLPSGDAQVATLDGDSGLDVLTCELVVAVEVMGQGTQVSNWNKAIAVVDGLHAALKAEAERNHIVERWAVRVDADQIGDAAYWLIVARVTGSN